MIERRVIEREERLGFLENLVKETILAQEETASELRANTALTQEIRELLELGKSFFTIMRYVGIVAKWVTIVGAAFAALIHFTPPPGK
jgi:hypothetical protein